MGHARAGSQRRVLAEAARQHADGARDCHARAAVGRRARRCLPSHDRRDHPRRASGDGGRRSRAHRRRPAPRVRQSRGRVLSAQRRRGRDPRPAGSADDLPSLKAGPFDSPRSLRAGTDTAGGGRRSRRPSRQRHRVHLRA